MSSNQVNIGEAKTHLSRLLERVAAGEEIIISKANRPIARLVPLQGARTPRRPGRFAGQIVVRDDFDAPLPEFEHAFYDGPIEP
ncbi:MAG: type II toxin-antitoxin system Phd/YefM family antitoxin [Deltaproteobacteria bacterium]|nr:type II toxin-antitoxin system Phd/YefM family antitoxin [Deltaproteobacteria bacterium]MCB9787978.1 type II toxin-antitoxin system Phd/YefM family antitoxin [Deltaproteobacteria bacterium]